MRNGSAPLFQAAELESPSTNSPSMQVAINDPVYVNEGVRNANSSLVPPPRVAIVQSNTGTGKTQWLTDCVRAVDPEGLGRFTLCLTASVETSTALAKRLGLVCYKDLGVGSVDLTARGLVCTIHSLHTRVSTFQHLRLLLIDEAEFVIRCLCDSIVSQSSAVSMALYHQLKSPYVQVKMCDARITDCTRAIVKACDIASDTAYYTFNQPVLKPPTVSFYESFRSWIDAVITAATHPSKRYMWIGVDTKRAAYTLLALLYPKVSEGNAPFSDWSNDDANIRVCTSDMRVTPEVIDAFGRSDESAPRIIIATSTCARAIDFSNPNCMVFMLCVAPGKGPDTQEFVQLASRNRTPFRDMIRMYVAPLSSEVSKERLRSIQEHEQDIHGIVSGVHTVAEVARRSTGMPEQPLVYDPSTYQFVRDDKIMAISVLYNRLSREKSTYACMDYCIEIYNDWNYGMQRYTRKTGNDKSDRRLMNALVYSFGAVAGNHVQMLAAVNNDNQKRYTVHPAHLEELRATNVEYYNAYIALMRDKETATSASLSSSVRDTLSCAGLSPVTGTNVLSNVGVAFLPSMVDHVLHPEAHRTIGSIIDAYYYACTPTGRAHAEESTASMLAAINAGNALNYTEQPMIYRMLYDYLTFTVDDGLLLSQFRDKMGTEVDIYMGRQYPEYWLLDNRRTAVVSAINEMLSKRLVKTRRASTRVSYTKELTSADTSLVRLAALLRDIFRDIYGIEMRTLGRVRTPGHRQNKYQLNEDRIRLLIRAKRHANVYLQLNTERPHTKQALLAMSYPMKPLLLSNNISTDKLEEAMIKRYRRRVPTTWEDEAKYRRMVGYPIEGVLWRADTHDQLTRSLRDGYFGDAQRLLLEEEDQLLGLRVCAGANGHPFHDWKNTPVKTMFMFIEWCRFLRVGWINLRGEALRIWSSIIEGMEPLYRSDYLPPNLLFSTTLPLPLDPPPSSP